MSTALPVTELMFHGLADGTSLASFYGLCNKAGPVRKCVLQNPSASATINSINSTNIRSRRLFGLVDYVHPASVPLAKLIFQQQSYRDMGILVSDAAISMSNRAPHVNFQSGYDMMSTMNSFMDSRLTTTAEYLASNSSINNSTAGHNRMITSNQEIGCEVALYNLPGDTTEDNLRNFLNNKSLYPQKCYVVQPDVLVNYARANNLPETSIFATTSAAILLFTEYMSAKVATFTDASGWGYLQRRLVGTVYRDKNAASSLYWDMNCYFQVRMITKSGLLWGGSTTTISPNSRPIQTETANKSNFLHSTKTQSNGNYLSNQSNNNSTHKRYLTTQNYCAMESRNTAMNNHHTNELDYYAQYDQMGSLSTFHSPYNNHNNISTNTNVGNYDFVNPILSNSSSTSLVDYANNQPLLFIPRDQENVSSCHRSNSNFSLSTASNRAESIHFSCSTRAGSVASMLSNDAMSYTSASPQEPLDSSEIDAACTTTIYASSTMASVDDVLDRENCCPSPFHIQTKTHSSWKNFDFDDKKFVTSSSSLPMVTMGVIEYLMDDPCW